MRKRALNTAGEPPGAWVTYGGKLCKGKALSVVDVHAKLQAQRPPLPEGLRLGAGEREDYAYNRTR